VCLFRVVVFEAFVGDAECREPLLEEVGVPVAVLLEGVRGGVELAAVEFDNAPRSGVSCEGAAARIACDDGGRWPTA
jgi:hypothetical protein